MSKRGVCIKLVALLALCASHGALSEPVSEASNRIIGGRPAEEGEFPFIVGLAKGGIHKCGGSIIDERHVITAAHCLPSSPDWSLVDLRVGCHERFNCPSVPIEGWKIHDDYLGKGDDIALIKTSEPIPLNKTTGRGAISAIKLPKRDTYYEDGTMLTVAGWGRTSRFDPTKPDVLMTVEVGTLSLEACRNVSAIGPSNVSATDICAGTNEKMHCGGDSGGPLIDYETEGIPMLVGIVSRSPRTPGADMKLTGVYTRVSSYLEWIEAAKHSLAS